MYESSRDHILKLIQFIITRLTAIYVWRGDLFTKPNLKEVDVPAYSNNLELLGENV